MIIDGELFHEFPLRFEQSPDHSFTTVIAYVLRPQPHHSSNSILSKMKFLIIASFIVAIFAAIPDQIVLDARSKLAPCTWSRPFFSPGELRMTCKFPGQASSSKLFGQKYRVERHSGLLLVNPYIEALYKSPYLGFAISMFPVKHNKQVTYECLAEDETSFNVVQSSFNVTVGKSNYDARHYLSDLSISQPKVVKCTFKGFFQ